jgi:ribosomal protein S18 acetylase RimI-like enzyme
LDAASSLVVEAGWNQVRADWQLFADLGSVFAVSDDSGALAATAATLPFNGFGWISMVLVRKAHRRQGIATALLEHCVAHLRKEGLVPVLDATPAGRTVYRPLGFRDGWAISRWRRTGSGASLPRASPDVTVRPFRDEDWPVVLALDAPAFGADRRAVLKRLHARSHGFACVAEQRGRVCGFLLGRDGRQATQIGPVVASDPEVATTLLADALARINGPVIVDALDRHTASQGLLPAAGFTVERGYTRMALTEAAAFGDAASMFAIAGPELG